MEWFSSIQSSIQFIEEHLTDNIRVEEVAASAYISEAHFQRMFTLVTGIPVGEYIRNRRLTMAGKDLSTGMQKVIDVAFKYQYETPESFTKAFSRFHGMNPSEAKWKKGKLRQFYPLSIQISIQGGFTMEHKISEGFYWNDGYDMKGTDQEQYKSITGWALRARCTNPEVFDALTEWILDDSEWTAEKLAENKQILITGVIERFKKQNEKLLNALLKLKPSGVVNEPVFKAINKFDDALLGNCIDDKVSKAAHAMYEDFSVMLTREVRELIAGNKTGSTGTDSVDLFGYVNFLKESDAGVQWTLFMPDSVAALQKGFQVDSFTYMRLPALRFIGFEGEEYVDVALRRKMMDRLLGMKEYNCGFDYELFLMHFYGKGVDTGDWHGVFGKFFRADAPVPEGYLSMDFLPDFVEIPGPPYLSQFAFAAFSGDVKAMHSSEGCDGDAMYDITRNIILSQGGGIPYPIKYWTAEVYFDGCDKESTGYLFSASIED